MSVANDIRWELDALLQRWLDAYPERIFPELTTPATTEEMLRAVMLARHILQSLSVEIESIFMDHEAKEAKHDRT